MGIFDSEESEERQAANIRGAVGRTFGTGDIDKALQYQAPKLWNMIVRTNDMMERQDAKTDEILATARQTNAAVNQFLQQAQQDKDAEYWRGMYDGVVKTLNRLDGGIGRMADAVIALKEQNEKKIGGR